MRRSAWAVVVAAAALSTAAASDARAAAPGAVGAPGTSGPPEVRNHELLVRYRATGQLHRIRVAPHLDPVALARELRSERHLFSSVGANLIARASSSPLPSTTPVPGGSLDGARTVPPSAAVAPPAGLKGWIPNDHIDGLPWTSLQWNFVGRWGVGAPLAWERLRRGPREGGAGVTVAVIDSGLAYRDRGEHRRSPDIDPGRVLAGYDFVDEDRYPDDESGHGTHVASTIAAATDNAAGLTGIAYRANILPIRVLDDRDGGDVLAIARGIRYAIRRNVDLINLSVDYPVETTAADVPEVVSALNAARKAGILVISSSGNDGAGRIAYPARASSVLAIGATTASGCRSFYSNAGRELALVAPGGGRSHPRERSARCKPGEDGPPIAQVTLMRAGQLGNLGVPLNYVGTSMSAAHVTGVAALVIGSRMLGRRPSPDLLAAYLVRSTRDLGPAGRDPSYGAGLIDAARAVSSAGASARVRGAKRAVATAASKDQRSLPIR